MSDKHDSISLLIEGREIRDFESYKISSDLFEAADAFEVTLADPDITVRKGQTVKLKVNGLLELNGVIDKVARSYDKEEGRRLTLSGRDLMGLVVDSYCTFFPDLQDMKLSDLAKLLLKDIPFVNRMKVVYGKGDKSRAVTVTREEEEYRYTQIKPGQTVFDVLKQKALEQGMFFFCLPDGTLMFGTPVTGGKSTFSFVTTRDGRNNNVMSAMLTEDISRGYKSVTVMGQRQGTDDIEAGGQNVLAIVTDESFPIRKPYVATVEYDGQDPKNYGKLVLDGMRFEAWQLELKVPGHSQDGKNYQVNTVCHVKDEVLGINSDLLCYGRTFELDKNHISTSLRLSRLGVMPA
jgi:prophage tail gpP-like protein